LTAQDGHLLHRNWLVVVGKEARKRSGLGILENPENVMEKEVGEEVEQEEDVQDDAIDLSDVRQRCLLSRNKFGKFPKPLGIPMSTGYPDIKYSLAHSLGSEFVPEASHTHSTAYDTSPAPPYIPTSSFSMSTAADMSKSGNFDHSVLLSPFPALANLLESQDFACASAAMSTTLQTISEVPPLALRSPTSSTSLYFPLYPSAASPSIKRAPSAQHNFLSSRKLESMSYGS
jgi:hypothetical protein